MKWYKAKGNNVQALNLSDLCITLVIKTFKVEPQRHERILDFYNSY